MSHAARNLSLFVITVFLFGVLCSAHAQTLTPIHIGVSTNSATWFPLYVAWKKGQHRVGTRSRVVARVYASSHLSGGSGVEADWLRNPNGLFANGDRARPAGQTRHGIY